MNSAMASNTDIAIVGGGIAGASLAYALAREGLGVTVLEGTTEYVDRVRGESMQCWGVVEARELGVEKVLLDAGAHMSPTLNLRHPAACQALVDAAAGAGATVVRGASHIELTRNGTTTLTYDVDGVEA